MVATAPPTDEGRFKSRTVEEILVEERVISPDQMQLVRLESLNTGRAVESVLLDRGFATEDQIRAARAESQGIAKTSLANRLIPPEILNLIPRTLAEQYTVIPLELSSDKNFLTVAMADPLDLNAITFIEKRAGKKVRPVWSGQAEIREAIYDHYTQNLNAEVTEALKDTPTPVAAVNILEGQTIRDTPVAKIVERILELAIRSRASDVHIEPVEGKTRVRFRVDGVLHEESTLPKEIHDSVVSRIKILSNLKIDERRLPQDGRFNFRSDAGEVDIRVSTLPTTFAEKVVLRLLPKSGGVPSLNDLGLRGLALKNLEIAILRPHGIIVVCGPTGSGKTTTLYSVIAKINSTRVNTVTIEDPVEYHIPGVNQVQVNPAAGLTFATALRAFLRQDPNIILVGEIRDRETTELAIQAALTGHLVFSTLHTSNASGTIPRFIDLGGEAFLLASSLNAVVGQRILRKICPHCKESFTPPEIMANDIKSVLGNLLPADKLDPGKIVLYRGKGCSECGETGFLGRVGIFEVLPVTDTIARLVLTHADSNEIEKRAVEEGMITMKQDGYLKAIEGVTTIEEVLRVAQD